MKKNLFFAALAVVAMASCSKNEAVDSTATTSVAKSISLDTFIDRTTKATTATTATLQSDGFNVIGYRHANVDASLSTNTQVTTIMPNWDVLFVDGAWDYTAENSNSTLSWEDPDQLSFFAYSGGASITSVAYSSTETNGTTAETKVIPTLAVTTDETISDQEDIIVASSLNNVYSASPSPITLDFNHILTKIGFTAEEGDDSGDAVVLSALTVEFVDADGNALKSEGTYNFSDGSSAEGWSIASAADALVSSEESVILSSSITLSETAQNVTADNGYIMIIPQELKGDNIVKVVATYKVGDGTEETKTVYLPAMTFEQGKWYTFNLVVADDTIRFSSAIKVNDFTGAEFEM